MSEMREILFRGKRIDDSKWVYGSVISFDDGKKTILPSKAKVFMQQGTTTICCNECYDVDIATVGQYTGLTDKNGVKIFEGDVVRECYKNCDIEEFRYNIGKVFYYEKAARFLLTSRRFPDCYADISIYREYKVIGNIHDNPELLEGESK